MRLPVLVCLVLAVGCANVPLQSAAPRGCDTQAAVATYPPDGMVTLEEWSDHDLALMIAAEHLSGNSPSQKVFDYTRTAVPSTVLYHDTETAIVILSEGGALLHVDGKVKRLDGGSVVVVAPGSMYRLTSVGEASQAEGLFVSRTRPSWRSSAGQRSLIANGPPGQSPERRAANLGCPSNVVARSMSAAL